MERIRDVQKDDNCSEVLTTAPFSSPTVGHNAWRCWNFHVVRGACTQSEASHEVQLMSHACNLHDYTRGRACEGEGSESLQGTVRRWGRCSSTRATNAPPRPHWGGCTC